MERTKFGLDDDGRRPPIRLPNEMLLFVAKSLDDRDCVALALSGAFDGFAILYDAERRGTAITIGYRHHFLSDPSHWQTFLSQNSCFPSTITVFDVTNCYWLPAQLICGVVVQLLNLEQLNIKGTEVSLSNLARVFTACQRITRLDFKFVEKSWEEVVGIVGKEKMDTVIEHFKKLTSLKLSTWWFDARDYLNDPWLLIIRILSWCRDCDELTVEISYNSYSLSQNTPVAPNSAEEEVQRMVKKNFFPKLEWMANLKKLVLIKYGNFYSEDRSASIRSLLLDDLCAFIFQEGRAPLSLQCVWIERFRLTTSLFPFWLNSPSKRTFYDSENDIDLSDEENHQMVLQNGGNIEHLAEIEELPSLDQREGHPRPYFPNLKYFHVLLFEVEDAQRLDDFLYDHPDLEQLTIDCYGYDYVPRVDLKLSKLTSLYVGLESTILSKERMDILANFCPNIETFCLVFFPPDENNDAGIIQDAVAPAASLSTIGFKKLTSLSLYGKFQLHDGAFLISAIKESPKLRSLQLDGTFEPDSFLANFDHFLSLATDFRDLRLDLQFNGNDSVVILFLKSILKSCQHLERLVLLLDSCPVVLDPSIQNHHLDLVDFLVFQFATKMKRLVCCCILFESIDVTESEKINRLIAEKVVINRPSLWFHVGFSLTLDKRQNIPWIHCLEMYDCKYYFPTPAF